MEVKLKRYMWVLAVYALLTISGIVSYKLYAQRLRFTEGMIVSKNDKTVLSFTYHGVIYDVKFSSLQRHELGESVQIVFNPKEPENAKLYNFYDYWLTKLSLFSLLLMFSSGLVVFLFRLKEIK